MKNIKSGFILIFMSTFLFGCQKDNSQKIAYLSNGKKSPQALPCNKDSTTSSESSNPPSNCNIRQSPLFYSGVVKVDSKLNDGEVVYILHGKQITGTETTLIDYKLQSGAMSLSSFVGQKVVLTGIPNRLSKDSDIDYIDVKSIEIDGVVSTQ